MASNRHLGRIVAMQTLYELNFRIEIGGEDVDVDEVLERNISRYKEVVDDQEFIKKLVRGVLKDEKDLDVFIQPLAPDWPLDQIARIDRTVLRMGVWEMQQSADKVPIKVIINEAVELAKGFGADSASKFVNGVLGTAARQLKLVDDVKPQKKNDSKDTKSESEDSKEKKS